MAKKKWDCIFSPCESLKKAMKQYKDLEGITFEIRLRNSESEKEIKYKIIYDAADVKEVKFREFPSFMEVTLIDGTVNDYMDCSYALVYDYEYYHKIETAEELKKEANRLGYNIIKRSEMDNKVSNEFKEALDRYADILPDIYINATKAREKTNENRNNNNYKQLENIFKFINEAINKGEYSINNKDLFITSEIKEILQKLGYKVESSNQYNEIMYKISWE